MNVLIERISDLNDLIMQGEVQEAFEKFYHEDVMIQYNDEKPVKGKGVIRKIREKASQDIIEMKSAKPLKVTVGEQTSMVEWQLNDEHRLYGERNYTQVAVQDWKEGLIIKEKMYCGQKPEANKKKEMVNSPEKSIKSN